MNMKKKKEKKIYAACFSVKITREAESVFYFEELPLLGGRVFILDIGEPFRESQAPFTK